MISLRDVDRRRGSHNKSSQNVSGTRTDVEPDQGRKVVASMLNDNGSMFCALKERVHQPNDSGSGELENTIYLFILFYLFIIERGQEGVDVAGDSGWKKKTGDVN